VTNSYGSMAPLDWARQGRVAADAFRQDPRAFNRAYREQIGAGFEPTPAEEALSSSKLIDYVRQHLPQRIADTALADRLPYNTPDWISNIPLGGYSAERTAARKFVHDNRPEVADRSYRRGFIPNPELGTIGEVPLGIGNRDRISQLAGVAAGDLIGTQGLQHLWWLINAAPAVVGLAQTQAIHNAGNALGSDGRWIKGYHGDEAKGEILTPLLKSRAMRMAATAPAWIGINFATGAFGRQPGYTASVPEEGSDDRRIAADPISETLSRLFLNREGKLLKYDDFVKERPDVSKGEYEVYKAYLHGSNAPIKATLDGINGPEVTFLGKSIPLLTGILPAVAGVIGARRGARMAAERLSQEIEGKQKVNLIEQRERLADDVARLKRSMFSTDEEKVEAHAQELEAAQAEYKRINNIVEGETLKQVLTWGGGSMTAAAILGSTLEAIRRQTRETSPAEEAYNNHAAAMAAGATSRTAPPSGLP